MALTIASSFVGFNVESLHHEETVEVVDTATNISLVFVAYDGRSLTFQTNGANTTITNQSGVVITVSLGSEGVTGNITMGGVQYATLTDLSGATKVTYNNGSFETIE